MITPGEIREWAKKRWENQSILRAALSREEIFPLEVPFRKPRAGELLEKFSELRDRIRDLISASKASLGHGYTVEMRVVANRTVGEQHIPSRVYFETPREFCRFLKKEKVYDECLGLAEEIGRVEPRLSTWIARHPFRALELGADWTRLLALFAWLSANPVSGLYARQVEIPGLDTKFLEHHRRVIRELAPLVCGGASGPPIADAEFEARLGLKSESPLIRFRVLDRRLAPIRGVSDISIPLEEFRRLELDCDRVFVTENRINGLAFPDSPGSIVIFGLGYGVSILREVPWLAERRILYWGDIDTHGFAILSRLRKLYPTIESFLMDRETLLKCRDLWGAEQPNERYLGDLDHLRPGEQELYNDLRRDRLGVAVRLEQERISFAKVREAIAQANQL